MGGGTALTTERGHGAAPSPTSRRRPTARPGTRRPAVQREREVSALIAEGLTNRQIARALSISEKTVGSHIDHIMTKLDLRSRTRIAVWAVEHGLGRPLAD